ncbi:MAG: hypothetical protein UZ08_BCD001000531 [Candidatus Parvibacillus calidus]|nr:MAG: hypothetical protein UZ08_BCD001000531 [Candidatus Parvibacillus calidus]
MPRLQSYRSMKLVYNECTFGINHDRCVFHHVDQTDLTWRQAWGFGIVITLLSFYCFSCNFNKLREVLITHFSSRPY